MGYLFWSDAYGVLPEQAYPARRLRNLSPERRVPEPERNLEQKHLAAPGFRQRRIN